MLNPYFDPNYQPYPPSVLIGTAVLFLVFSVVAVALRFYARLKSVGRLALDDWITVPSMVICVALCITQIITTTEGGMSTHKTTVNGQFVHTKLLDTYAKSKYAYQILGTIGLALIKIAVLLYYRRIFSVKSFRIINDVLIGLTLAWGIAFTLVIIFQCNPISTLWEKFEFEFAPYCINVLDFYMSVAVSDLILDVIIFILPIPQIWQLQLRTKQKFAVAGIFLLGSIVVAIGITRTIVYHWVISFIKAEPIVYSSDVLWYHPGTLLWHLAENVVGLVGCCLPCYAPLVRGLQKKKTSRGTTEGSAITNSRSKADGYPSRHHQRLEDEESLTRPPGSTDSDQAVNGFMLQPIYTRRAEGQVKTGY